MVDLKTPRNSVVGFDKRSSVEIYDSYSSVGLCIIRPNRKEIQLDTVTKNNVTVFYPFLKNHDQHDEPEAVTLEYLYMKEQTINITR